jgi:microcystin-dependent protein
MPISGTGIPAGATVSSVTSNTIVISSAAIGSGTSTAAVCPYGVGDTVNTFNLPDTRGIFLRGIGTNPSNVNNTTTIGTRQLDDFKSHAHSLVSTQNTGFGYAAGGNSPVWEKGGASGAQTIGSTGGTETRPANVGVNHIIKV